MSRSEVDTLIGWAAGEGWNPGRSDAECFWAADPQGFLAVEVDGQLAGGGSIVRHNSRFGFMGLFILQPQFRGHGFGKKLWFERRDRLCSRLAADGCIGLDAVTDMIPFYARGGFRTHVRHLRHEFSGAGLDCRGASDDPQLIPLDNVPLADVLELDGRCFPGPRDSFVRTWLQQVGSVAIGYQTDDGLAGYSLMRPCEVGWKIAPLFAKDADGAELLLRHCLIRAGQASVYVDVPECNSAAMALCQKYGGRIVFECTRMYLGPPPELEDGSIFGISSLELG